MTDTAAEGSFIPLEANSDVLHTKTLEGNAPSAYTEAFKDIACGAVSGMVGKTIEYPFDTIKVRLQSQPEHLPPRYAGPLDCFRQSLRAEGVPWLYRGISAPLFGAAVETSSLFFSYRVAQRIFLAAFPEARYRKDGLPLSMLVACGGASGAFTSLFLTPIELVKCQMQVPTLANGTCSPTPLTIISSVFRHHGIFGFWYGQLGTLIRETGGSAAWFGSYEGVKILFKKSETLSTPAIGSDIESKEAVPVYQQMLAGASAGMTYNFIFFPADTIKSRMQTEEVNATGKARTTFWTSGEALWKQQGLKGMYKGCGITVARSAPSSAFIFVVYEKLVAWWK
ncbi:hypothetical protein MMC21_007217 [Puttea exsequens]|nr:hypothetical protein [Puttea exsequens]